MRLYHFINKIYGIHAIYLRRLKLSRVNELNAPFEFLAADLLNHLHRDAFRNFKNEFNDKFGMICFSSQWKNPLLWSHYADRHRGIALGFEVPDGIADEVIYTTSRPKVYFDMNKREVIDGENVIDFVRRSKFKDWSYESEYRLFYKLDEVELEGGNYFQTFDDNLVLSEVLIGMECPVPVSRLKAKFEREKLKVRVKKMRMAVREFKIVEDR